ncbi:hypothetical protein FQR65_LT12613 [Abscondita terminalis]|nr:hypothetical protein FQR65_LT12613 [Abscondita terminalis]
MNAFNILVLCALFVAVKCSCTNEFDAIEEECAKSFGLNPTNAFYFFTRGYSTRDISKVHNFVSCTWRKWKFQDPSGNIDYNTIKEDKKILWKFARFCEGLVSDIQMYQNAFVSATLECQKTSTPLTAEGARLCITENYQKYITE